MKTYKLLMTCLVTFALLIGTCVPAFAETCTINVTVRGQEQSNWCWAATTQMIIEYLDTWSPLPSQTDIVTTVKGSAVNEGATDTENTNSLNWYMVSTTKGTTISFNTVKTMIQGWNSPIKAKINWKSGGAHNQIIYGYEENGSAQGLYCIDPLYGGEYKYYGFNEYKDNSDFYWTVTWYNNKLSQ